MSTVNAVCRLFSVNSLVSLALSSEVNSLEFCLLHVNDDVSCLNRQELEAKFHSKQITLQLEGEKSPLGNYEHVDC
ncbi:hypothetical protein [Metabacillus niabensis]|uniref:Uncharacterized protein n=1 Tax=Metabacillus niabensis TaxID=324854 RepID=A0ABT9YXI4_9BACI|nr:hypothetical protein [Metabacillus niabensis]MDQ0224316.1 hypothetical protein [Metabacillus niabensis]